MNLLAARVVLRQRSLADTLDLALPFCLANKRPIGVLSLVMLGPIAALLGYLRIARHWELAGAVAAVRRPRRWSSRARSPSRWASCCSNRRQTRAYAAGWRGSSAGCPRCWSRSSFAR